MTRRWVVCYCEPKKALGLAERLRATGVSAECPYFEFRRRVPRRNRTETRRMPLIGGILFVGAQEWPLGPQVVASLGEPTLRPMLAPGGGSGRYRDIAVIEDKELDGLRLAAGEVTRDRREIYPGDLVEVCRGPLAGISAVVLKVGEDSITLEVGDFGGRIEIAPFLLRKKQA